MKTVMKKMFCLLLVAVLLVGVMPFAAFAAGAPYYQIISPSEDNAVLRSEGNLEARAYNQSEFSIPSGYTFDYATKNGNPVSFPVELNEGDVLLLMVNPVEVHTHTPGADATCTTAQVCTGCGETLVASLGHSAGAAATCTTAQVCTRCGETLVGVLGHDYAAATCTAPETCSRCGDEQGEANGHNYGTDSVCDDCGHCKHCGRSDGTHPNTCSNSADYESTCGKCGETYLTAEGHPECEVCEGCHTTKKCPYCAVCWDDGDKVKTHKTKDHCIECGKTDGTHKNTCSDAPEVGNATVKVHVRLYTSNVLTDTVELLTYKDYKDARIYSSVAAHEDLIRAKLEAKYPGYKWSGNLYDNPGKVEDTKETIGKGTTVYINAYSDQDLVYIYVHNSRSMNNLRIIQLDGKKVGETITKSEVKKAVSKYFNYSSLSMYSEQAWEDYVDGESVESVSSLKITTDPYFIDVKISGAASTSSGSGYTADSSNPKTGDEIFAPVMILGLSASALAVLFFLNKKRAF